MTGKFLSLPCWGWLPAWDTLCSSPVPQGMAPILSSQPPELCHGGIQHRADPQDWGVLSSGHPKDRVLFMSCLLVSSTASGPRD